VADAIGWPVEEIPDTDAVFMRAHRAYLLDGELSPGVCREQGGGMSVDWERYSTAEQTKQRAKKPEDNAVIKMPVIGIRDIKPLIVEHTPDYPVNRAHAEVFGMPQREQCAETRLKLLRIADIVIGV
jgi:hypothetical protein